MEMSVTWCRERRPAVRSWVEFEALHQPGNEETQWIKTKTMFCFERRTINNTERRLFERRRYRGNTLVAVYFQMPSNGEASQTSGGMQNLPQANELLSDWLLRVFVSHAVKMSSCVLWSNSSDSVGPKVRSLVCRSKHNRHFLLVSLFSFSPNKRSGNCPHHQMGT